MFQVYRLYTKSSNCSSFSAMLLYDDFYISKLSTIISQLFILLYIYFNQGKGYVFDPCGRAFATIPAMFNGPHPITGSKTENIACNIDFLIYTLTNTVSRR